MNSDSDLTLFRGDVLARGEVLRDGGLLVGGGTVRSVLDAGAADRARSDRVQDHRGKLLLPGFVDAHVHSFSGPGEGWEHSTRAAAAGGVTTIIEMPYDADAPVVNASLFEAKRERIGGRCAVDVALLATIEKRDGVGAAESLIQAGACGFKVSLFETDPRRFPRIAAHDLMDLMTVCARHGIVVGFHAEDTEIVDKLAAEYRESAPTDPLSHGRSRPPIAENLATVFALQLARDVGCPVHIYHASLGSVIDMVDRYRTEGVDASVETCPHYLVLSEEEMPNLGAFGKINPPLRSAAERALLWERVSAGKVDMITSDHAPWPLARKSAPVIFDNASGTPGIDVLAPLVLGLGYLGGRLGLLDCIRMLSTGPARRFGLGEVKGDLAEGMDADICVFDPAGHRRISAADSYSSAGWSPYEGLSLPGSIAATYVRGRQVSADGVVADALDHGRFVAREARMLVP